MAKITIENVKADSPYIKIMAEQMAREYAEEYERIFRDAENALSEMKVGETKKFSTKPFEIVIEKTEEDAVKNDS